MKRYWCRALAPAVGCLVLFFEATAAGSFPEPLSESTHVLVGRVQRVFHIDERYEQNGVQHHHVVDLAEIAVEHVEKGRRPEAGVVYIQFIQHFTIPVGGTWATPAPPKQGDRVRLYLVRRDDGRFEVKSNPKAMEGLDPLK